MSARCGRRLCAAIVALWGVTLCALFGDALRAPASLRVAVRPATPALPAEGPPLDVEKPPHEPAPPEPPAEAAAARPSPVAAEDLARGEALLQGAGAFPPLHASYDDLGSFDAYARAMRALGSRFVVVSQRRVMGEIDAQGRLLAERLPPGRFSPRARDYSDEPALASARRRARDRWGPGSTVMLLVPRRLDAALFGAVARGLAEHGESPEDYRSIEARYEQTTHGTLQLRVEVGTKLDGSRRELGLALDLSALAGKGA